jgi:hypothetical protein
LSFGSVVLWLTMLFHTLERAKDRAGSSAPFSLASLLEAPLPAAGSPSSHAFPVALSTADSCSLLLDAAMFRPRVLACAIALHVIDSEDGTLHRCRCCLYWWFHVFSLTHV